MDIQNATQSKLRNEIARLQSALDAKNAGKRGSGKKSPQSEREVTANEKKEKKEEKEKGTVPKKEKNEKNTVKEPKETQKRKKGQQDPNEAVAVIRKTFHMDFCLKQARP